VSDTSNWLDQVRIAVIGLGYVGLPLAVEFGKVLPVTGFDIKEARVFNEIGWHGLAMAEFKVSPSTGQYWFIEVNPRLWGSLPLAVASGVEFPYLAWLCATQGPDAAISWHNAHPPKLDWRNRWLLGDAFLAARDIFGLRPGAAWDKLFNSSADRTDDWFWDDPGAFLGEIVRYVHGAISSGSLNGAEEGMLG